jgi:hypothetical protein
MKEYRNFRFIILILILIIIYFFSFNSNKKVEYKILENEIIELKDFPYSYGGEISFKYDLLNNYDSSINIDSIVVDCGCITIENLNEEILPNEKFSITIKYRPESEGSFEKNAYLYYNIDNIIQPLTLKGNIVVN